MVQALEVHVGLGNALAAESIQSPKHQQVELSLRAVRLTARNSARISLPAGFVVRIDDDGSVLGRAEFAELVELVRGLLAFVVGRYTGIGADPIANTQQPMS
jgi:hypothetical protein